MNLSDLTRAGIESTLNGYLDLDPEARGQMATLHGKVIAIEATTLSLTLYLAPSPHRLLVLGRYDGEPSCRLKGTPLALARLANRQRGGEPTIASEVEISGDTEVAHRFSSVLNRMEVDWEAQLARLTSPTIAHGASDLLQGLCRWGESSLEGISQQLHDYLQEEAQLLPSRREIDTFNGEVDRLRDDAERLAARIRRLGGGTTPPAGRAEQPEGGEPP